MRQYFLDVWRGVFTVLIGMRETWNHLFRQPTTLQYPHVQFQLPAGTRQQLFNTVFIISRNTSRPWR